MKIHAKTRLKAYNDYEDLKYIRETLKKRAELINARKQFGLDTYHELKRIKRAYLDQYDEYNTIENVLSYKGNSSFLNSLANQIRAWAKQANPKYNTPLSNKQLKCLL